MSMKITTASPIQILGTIIFAFLLVGVAGGTWSFLLVRNLHSSPVYPWCVAAMGVLLWILWQYLSGRWGPRKSAEYRSRALRANPLPTKTFVLALIAGLSAVMSLAGLWIVLSRLTTILAHPLPDFSLYPAATVVLVLFMAALVNAIAEEAGLRGYLQGMLEQRFGGVGAIVATALLMAPAHGATQGFAWQIVVFYLLIDVALGTVAYLTNSILPGILVHAAGLLLFFTVIWRPEAVRFTLWEGTAAFAIFGAISIAAYLQLAESRRKLLMLAP